MQQSRSCGSCSACCTFLRIDSQAGFSTRLDNNEDIAKKAGEPCRFLAEQGCGIYGVRPLVCRRFRCDWLDKRKGFELKDSPLNTGFFSLRGDIFYIKTKAL